MPNHSSMDGRAPFDFDKELKRQMRSLARRSRSEHEVRHRLQERGIPEAEIDGLIDRLSHFSFIDDERYAIEFTRSKSARGFGEHRVRRELAERGCPDRYIDHAFAELAEETRQEPLLQTVIERRLATKGNPETPRQLKQLVDFCTRRGFDHDLIRGALTPWFNRILGD